MKMTSNSNDDESRESLVLPTFVCTVCREERPMSESVVVNEVCRMSHVDRPCCQKCTTRHIAVNVSSLKCASIDCIWKSECGTKLDPLRCRDLNLVSPDVFRQWCDLLCESSLLGYERCYCPNLACNELIIIEDERRIKQPDAAGRPRPALRIVCPSCNIDFCFRCFSAWNGQGIIIPPLRKLINGIGIIPYNRTTNKDHRCSSQNNISVVERNKWVQQCPGCKNYVQHSQAGCSIITCRCYTEFCYKCGRRTKGHSCSNCGPIVGRRRLSNLHLNDVVVILTSRVEILKIIAAAVMFLLLFLIIAQLTGGSSQGQVDPTWTWN